MKKTILTLMYFCMTMSLAWAQKTPVGATYTAEILRVTDGDTVVVAARYLPAPLKPELAVRIYGVDTPEKGRRAQCATEAALGDRATAWTQGLIANGKQFQVTLYRWDKFGGRVLGDIIVDGQSVRNGLISQGLAREYYGDTKQSWCQ